MAGIFECLIRADAVLFGLEVGRGSRMRNMTIGGSAAIATSLAKPNFFDRLLLGHLSHQASNVQRRSICLVCPIRSVIGRSVREQRFILDRRIGW